MNKKLLPFLFLLVLGQSSAVAHASNGEIDIVDTVIRVEDGDTLKISSGEWIRLADVDAPEINETGYDEAKAALFGLTLAREVCLDADDINGDFKRDQYGRLVCVVYVAHNSTHYWNINKELLERQVVTLWDYSNEFDPNTWTLYIHKETIPEFTSILVPAIFILTTLIMITFCKKSRNKKPLQKLSTH